jgi:hypothetical protein
VEVCLLLAMAGIVLGAGTRRNRAGRLLLWSSMVVMLGLGAVFGAELLRDLL